MAKIPSLSIIYIFLAFLKIISVEFFFRSNKMCKHLIVNRVKNLKDKILFKIQKYRKKIYK